MNSKGLSSNAILAARYHRQVDITIHRIWHQRESEFKLPAYLLRTESWIDADLQKIGHQFS